MIEKIRDYFRENNIIDKKDRLYVDFLGKDPSVFALEPIPVDPKVPGEQYINGSGLRQYQFQLISCNHYGADVMQNIANSTFYERLYDIVENNNKKGILPDINNIESIECLNNGAILDAGTNTARYSIQMRITYMKY